jgi:7-cyano-7-deazaguanine synthase
MNKAVILLSGGLDSVTTLYFAKSQGYKLCAIIFDYNQRHKNEIEFAKKIAELNSTEYHLTKINLGWVKSSLTDEKVAVPHSRNLFDKEIPLTYVSARNIIFLSYAFSLAESIEAKKIFIGAHIQDYSGYPDCRPEFFDSFQKAFNSGMKYQDIKIVTPLIDKSKKEIIELGQKLGVPFKYTWSCYEGGEAPCEKCDSCRFRIEAFNQIGMTDPLLTAKKSLASFCSYEKSL